jgi:serine/threonine protein kinase
LTAVSGRLDELHRRDCDVLAVSTDNVATHEQWLTPGQGGIGSLHFPLGADEDGAVSRAYGVYVPRQHVALRGLFIIDPNGVLQYQVVHSLSVGRGTDEVLRVLDALQQGGLCPSDWAPGQASLDASQQLGPGRVVGQYRIDAILGKGSFGTVFKAWDVPLDRPVALKVFRNIGASPSDSIFNEARVAAALNHPNVCIVHSIDSSHGFPMIVMEYVEGQTLAEQIATGPLPRADAKAIGRQLANGLAAAHAHGVVHGDLKPANVMVTASGIAKLMDFGLAKRADRPKSPDETVVWTGETNGAISGTPFYMAPEQSRGEPATPATDVFALGLVFYEMLTGRRALNGATVLDVFRRLDSLDPIPLAAEVGEPFGDVLRRALIPDVKRRAFTMGNFAEALS